MRFIYLFLFLLVTYHSIGQPTEDIFSGDSINVIGNATKNVIQLRWAPDNHISWKRLNYYGYTIERVTIMREGQLVPEPQISILHSSPIKPLPLSEWEKMVEENDWAAIAAQALYGENFELTTDAQTDLLTLVNISKEQEQRFSFALYAADQSFEVAKMAGLGFEDNTVKEGEKYVYRLKSNVPNDIASIKMGKVFVGLDNYAELPVPYDLNAEFSDKSVSLSWEQQNFYGIFNSYIVEKSIDGGANYESITKKPIINTFNNENKQSRLAYKLDSLDSNDKIYYYRVRGITPFGQISNPSDSIFGKGISPLKEPPSISGWSVNENLIEISWSFPSEKNKNIDGFYIERGVSAKGPFDIISSVASETRSYKDNPSELTNYYRVIAYSGENQITSFPILVQLEDSILPVAPVELKYAITSEGEVYLSWEANTEPDLLGYRIFRSNFNNSEFSEITSKPILTNSFNDDISIKNLTKNIYYQVRAIDQRYNPSEPSKTLSVKRPDLVPPVTPIINEIRSDDKGIHINFIPSSSEDVIKHEVFRRKDGEEDWILVEENNTSESTYYLDENPESNETYHYRIIAVDNSGLNSQPSRSLSAIYNKPLNDFNPENLKAKLISSGKSVVLSWNVNDEVKSVKIYRAKDGEPLAFYKSLNGEVNQFEDNKVELNNSYLYGVQFEDFKNLVSKIKIVQTKK